MSWTGAGRPAEGRRCKVRHAEDASLSAAPGVDEMMWDPPPRPSRRSWSTCLLASTRGYRALPSRRRRSGLCFGSHGQRQTFGIVLVGLDALSLERREQARALRYRTSRDRRRSSCLSHGAIEPVSMPMRASSPACWGPVFCKSHLARSGMVRARAWAGVVDNARFAVILVTRLNSTQRSSSNLKCANQRASAPGSRHARRSLPRGDDPMCSHGAHWFCSS